MNWPFFLMRQSDVDELTKLRGECSDKQSRIAVLEERVRWLERIESEYCVQVTRQRQELTELLNRLLYLTNTERRPESADTASKTSANMSSGNPVDWQADAQQESDRIDREVMRRRLTLTTEAAQEAA
jgi:hypothetical protein